MGNLNKEYQINQGIVDLHKLLSTTALSMLFYKGLSCYIVVVSVSSVVYVG